MCNGREKIPAATSGKNNEDCIERVITDNGRFFGVACSAAALVGEGCGRHDAGPLAAAALGRAMVGAALLAALMKDGQSLTVKFAGNGVLQKVMAEAGYDGRVRGYVGEPHAELPLFGGEIDVAGGICGRNGSGVGAGVLTVNKSILPGKSYPGTVPLQSGEISEEIARYLTLSEQKPSTVAITVSLLPTGEIAAAGGFLVQALPPGDDTELATLEAGIASLPPLSTLLATGTPPQEILSRIFRDIPHHFTRRKPLQYRCGCSQKKMEHALITLGKKDLLQLAAEREECEVRCEFCRRRYVFSATDICGLAHSLPSRQPGIRQEKKHEKFGHIYC